MAAITFDQLSKILVPKIFPVSGNEVVDKLKAGCKVLDVGCGNGTVLRLISELCVISYKRNFRASKHEIEKLPKIHIFKTIFDVV